MRNVPMVALVYYVECVIMVLVCHLVVPCPGYWPALVVTLTAALVCELAYFNSDCKEEGMK